MANDNVALSQDEVDKLLGRNSKNKQVSEFVNKKQYKLNPFLSEEQLSQLNEVCVNVYKYFKMALRERAGEPKIRKLTVTSLDHQNIIEFFDSVSDNDFIYEAKFGRAKMYVKLDTFLLCALCGIKIDASNKINSFQSEVLKEYVVTCFVQGFARQMEKKHKIQIESLFQKDRKPYRRSKTGICISINWNENLHSFGIEKLFLTKEMIELLRTFSSGKKEQGRVD